MPAPTKYPDWATDESNNVEPPDAKKAEGWVPAEEPPSSWFNWWKNLVGLWVRWLESVTDDHETRIADGEAALARAAYKDEINVFTMPQGISNPLPYMSSPRLSTEDYPGQLVVGVTPNRWMPLIAARTTSTSSAGIYVGTPPYGAALVNNARWDVDDQSWYQGDSSLPSTALVGRSGQYVASIVPAGSPGWTDWPSDGGADFIASGNVLANGGGSAGNVIAKNKFQYLPVQTHWFMLWPEGSYTTFLDRVRLSPADTMYFRIRLPTGAVIGQVNVKMEEYTGCIYTIELKRTESRPFDDATSPGNIDHVDDTVTVSGGGTGVLQNHILNFPTLTVDNEFTNYWVRIICDNASPADIDVYGAQIGFVDPGPRNH